MIPQPLRRLAAMAIAALTLSLTHSASAFSTVVIDPGHGGHDLGGHSGKVYEKHLALDTALRLEHYLKSRGIRTVMTRRSDTFISLPGRVSKANRYSNSIFVSIHYNYTWKRDPHGIETHYYSSRSKRLATYVQAGMMNKINTINRGVKHSRFYVIRNTRSPAVLVECGFVTHSRERKRMKKGWFRHSVAEGIGEGIIRYKKSL